MKKKRLKNNSGSAWFGFANTRSSTVDMGRRTGFPNLKKRGKKGLFLKRGKNDCKKNKSDGKKKDGDKYLFEYSPMHLYMDKRFRPVMEHKKSRMIKSFYQC